MDSPTRYIYNTQRVDAHIAIPVCPVPTPTPTPTPTGPAAVAAFPVTYRARGTAMPLPYSFVAGNLIADLSGRPDAVDDVEDVRLRARGVGVVDGGGDVDARTPGVDGRAETKGVGGGDTKVREPVAGADEGGVMTLGVGNEGRGRAPLVPPVAVLTLAADTVLRTLATEETDLTERTDCVDAFEAARSRRAAVEVEDMLKDMDAGMGTDVEPVWREAVERRDDKDAVFGILDERDCGREMVVVLVSLPDLGLRGMSPGIGGNALEMGRGATAPGRTLRCIRNANAEGASSLSRVGPPRTGMHGLRGGSMPSVKGRRVASPGEAPVHVGVGLRSSSRAAPVPSFCAF